VPVRVSPTGRIRRHIDELFASDRPLPEILEDVAWLGAQLLMQAALEAEVTEFLGRDRDQRAVGWRGRSCAAPSRRLPPACSAAT
jgi:putative transposase